MNIVEKKLENSRMELKIDVPENDVEEEYSRVFVKLQTQVQIKGFRKGKVPMEIVTQKFREAADQEVAENILKTKYVDAVKEKSLSPVSMPEFELDKVERGKPLSFTVRFDVSPTVEIGKYKGLGVDEFDSKIEEKDVDNEIQILRERHASISKKEDDKPADKADFVRVMVKRIDNIEPAEIEKAQYNEVPIIVGRSTQEYDLDEHVVGMKINEEKEVTIKYPRDYYVKDISGQKVKYLVKMHEINKMTLPELDDEFAKDLGECETLAGLRAKIRENLENFVKDKAKSRAKFDLLEKVVGDSKYDLPESLIRAEMKSVFRRFQYSAGLPEVTDIDEVITRLENSNKEFYENIRNQAVKNIKSNLALAEVAKQENLKVSEEKYRQALEDLAKRNNRNLEEIEKIAAQGDTRENIESDLILSDSFDFIYNNSKVHKQKPVSYSEFVKL